MDRRTRNVYNALVYGLLRGLFFWSSAIEFFPDANGDSLTFRHGSRVYKCWNIPFLFRPRSFHDVVAMHQAIIARGLGTDVPEFKTSPLCISYEYIAHARDLTRALLEEPSAEKRVALLARALALVDRFHQAGILHGDLKPKNILVAPDGRLYLIDLEDAVLFDDQKELVDDYRKFFPRLIYLFTADEMRQALADMPDSMHAYLEQYLAPFDCRALIAEIPGLSFERAQEAPGEDIDISVPGAASIAAIEKRIERAGLGHRLFFRSRNDAKLFAYNLSGVAEIDVHLAQSISRFELMREKTRRHAPVQIAVTGPDGVGKSTLLAAIFEHPEDALLARFPKRLIHAWRFAREGWVAPAVWTIAERAKARWRQTLLGRRIAYERFLRRNTEPLVLLDRSFYDPYLQGSGRARALPPGFFFPRDVQTILLAASPAVIAARKPQLSAEAIGDYYRHASRRLPTVAIMSAEGSVEEVQKRLERLIRFFAFTQDYFLP